MSTKQKEREEASIEESEVVTPVLSVDESQSVEERMTQNVVENILPARYLNKDDNGNVIESPEELFDRVADNVATAEFEFTDDTELAQDRLEEWRAEFGKQMKELRFMPNSPTLMNAGNELQQLSACFVDSPSDDMEDIMETAKEAALIFKSGGGMGYSFSHLRPKGALVSSTKGKSSGPISFMRLFDETCNQVKQGGVRRGAQMAIMRVDHPDIGRFATAKRKEGEFSNFNISVAVTDEFVEAVKNDDSYTLYAPSSEYEGPFNTAEETAQFYNKEYQESPDSIVDENIWRDHAGSTEAWDWDNSETISLEEKWADHFEDEYTTKVMQQGKEGPVHEYDTYRSEEELGLDDEYFLVYELDDDATFNVSEGEEMALPARFIWDMMIDGAWRNGEPGLFYIDETNREHTFDIEEHPEYEIHATNPCAEQPLCEYEACNLGHINLSLVVQDDAPSFDVWMAESDHDYDTTRSAVTDYVNSVLDFEELDRTIEAGTRFLDNVVTMSDFPLDEIENRVNNMRKIGLGVMGWAQMLYQFGIPYGSDESYEAGRHVMQYIDTRSTWESHKLAEERGSFGVWDKSKYADPTRYPEWFHQHTQQDPSDWEDGFPMRNHNVTTVAPTGTTSMVADTSGGIEPVFNVAYKKNVGNDIQGDDKLVEFDSYFVKALEANGYSIDNIKEVAAAAMDANEFDGASSLPISDKLAEIFVTTNDLTSEEHGTMQRAFQAAVDSGISKTVNLPKDATHNDVHDAYMLALSDEEFGSPIKGLTVYRDQSREEQVLTTQEHSDKEVEQAKKLLENVGYTIEGGEE